MQTIFLIKIIQFVIECKMKLICICDFIKVITEVTTTRTITISDDADLKSDPNIASLIAQFSDTELHSSDPNPTMGVRNVRMYVHLHIKTETLLILRH